MRLTNDMRTSICAELLTRRFQDQEKQLALDKTAFADFLYESWFSNEEMILITQCPSEWFTYTDSIGFTYQGNTYNINLSKHRRIPASHDRYRSNDLSPALAKKWQKWTERDTSLRDKRYDLKSKCLAVMRSVTTTQRLVEIWPELQAFIPTEGKGPAMCTALSIPMKELNADLGLP